LNKKKIFTFSSDYKNWQQVRIVEKSIDVGLLTATSEYKFLFLYLFRTTIFQRSILFKTNNYHRGATPLPPPPDPALSAGASTKQRESPLDTEGHNLAKFQMNSHLGKLQVSRKKGKGRSYKVIHSKSKQLHFNMA